MMVIEYAHRQEYTQSMLFSFASAFFLQAVRYGRAAGQLCDAEPLSDRLLRYIEDHSDTVTLKALSDRFFYQPGYLSALIKRKFGKSFTALLSDQRMKKGGILLKNTSLSVEEIARDRLQQCQQLLPLLPEILPYVAAGIRRTVFLKGGAYPNNSRIGFQYSERRLSVYTVLLIFSFSFLSRTNPQCRP